MKLLLALLLLPLACAARPANGRATGFPENYLPMKVGNYWKYKYTGLKPQTFEIRILSEQTRSGKPYFQFSGWFGLAPSGEPVWLAWSDGSIYLWDGKEEKKWIGEALPDSRLQRNEQTSQITFQDCLSCADAGSTITFQKDKGVVAASFTAIWGDANYELIETNSAQKNSR